MTDSPFTPLAGPSRQQTTRRKRKEVRKPKVRPVQVQKLTRKQKLDDLDRYAMTFEPPADLRSFSDLPLSEPTKEGLKKAFFVEMTDIQTESLPASLKGKDVLGAARTGSGKTLAFLIPVLEILYRRSWGPTDGLGALIISPTRELAVQIFEVLRSIGGYHTFSAGLVIGGKNLKDERDRLSRMNILVATPGRLLQHMDQTVGFDSDNMQLLVLDEADRILDMGFQKTLTALLNHLPKSRQTLLFSATQTDSVSDLARLSLKDPVCIGVSSDSSSSSLPMVPKNLEQHYLLVTLDQKLSVLWSFIKTHLQCKTIVFLSSCKQVRFVFETFCRMHPGVPLLHLHGKQKQSARLTVYKRFIGTSHAVLIATDVAARGLDFPAIDWVIQVDAPEDAETYIHRVGRTARYESKGRALLFLMPSEEEGMKLALQKKGIDVARIKNKQSKTQDIQNQLQKLAFQDPEIKYLGQRAFVSYLRSVYIHRNKSIFKLDELPVDSFAESLGLPGTPKIKFLSKAAANQRKNASRALEAAQADVEKEMAEMAAEQGSESESEEEAGRDASLNGSSASEGEDSFKDKKPSEVPKVRTKYDRMFGRKNQTVLSEHYTKLIEHGQDSQSDSDDFIQLKRADHDLDQPGPSPSAAHNEVPELSKRKLKLSRTKRAIAKYGKGTKLIFDDTGNAHELYEMADPEAWYRDKGGLEGANEAGKQFAEVESGKMRVADVQDRQEAREKKREKKRKRKEKERQMQATASNKSYLTEVLPPDSDDGYISPAFDLPDDGEEPDVTPPPPKKARFDTSFSKKRKGGFVDISEGLEDEETLALKLLGRS